MQICVHSGIFNRTCGCTKFPIVCTSFSDRSLHIMPRAWDVIVPNAVPGIEEVVVTHTRTKRGGTRTKEKVIPVVLSSLAGSSKSKKGSKTRLPPTAQDSASDVTAQDPTEYPEEHQFIDEQDHGILDPKAQPHQQSSVSVK